MKIGFIGLGHMGLPMATNLLKKHTVYGFDVLPAPLEALKKHNGNPVQRVEALPQDLDVIITMLQTGQQVLELSAKIMALRPKLYIDCSTIDVETARMLHASGDEAGVPTLDAPVSGGVAGAANASLTFMVGGKEHTLSLALPCLQLMGKNIIHTGEAGSGQAAKICNNMILGISMVAVSEAFLLAEQLGLSAEKLFEVVNQASGQCWVMSHYPPYPHVLPNVPANNDYQPGFTAAMMLKDLKLSIAAAEKNHLTLPMGDVALRLYEQLQERGMSHLDFSAIIRLLAESSPS